MPGSLTLSLCAVTASRYTQTGHDGSQTHSPTHPHACRCVVIRKESGSHPRPDVTVHEGEVHLRVLLRMCLVVSFRCRGASLAERGTKLTSSGIVDSP